MGKEVIILLVVVMLSILVIASEDFNKYYKIYLSWLLKSFLRYNRVTINLNLRTIDNN